MVTVPSPEILDNAQPAVGSSAAEWELVRAARYATGKLAVAMTVQPESFPTGQSETMATLSPYLLYSPTCRPLLAFPDPEQSRVLEAASSRITVIRPVAGQQAPGTDTVLRMSIANEAGQLYPVRSPDAAPHSGEHPTLSDDSYHAFNAIVGHALEQELQAIRAEHGLDELRVSAGVVIASDEPFWRPVDRLGPYQIREYIPSPSTIIEPHYAHHDTQGPPEPFGRQLYGNTRLHPRIAQRLTTGVQAMRRTISERYPEQAMQLFGVVRVYHPGNVSSTMRYGSQPHPSDAARGTLLHVFITPYTFPMSTP